MSHAKKRYAENAKDVGEAFIYIPETAAPEGGWPVIVWLHGYLDNGDPESYMADVLSQDKAVVVGVNGVYKYSQDSFYWSFDEFESTQKAVQAALTKLTKQTKVNKDKVALIGFSLGAMHASQLVANYPDDYAGALILSPGGAPKELTAKVPEGKIIVISHGEAEAQGNLKLAKEAEEFFGSTNNKVKVSSHEGGHSFDSQWREVYPKFLAEILGYTLD